MAILSDDQIERIKLFETNLAMIELDIEMYGEMARRAQRGSVEYDWFRNLGRRREWELNIVRSVIGRLRNGEER